MSNRNGPDTGIGSTPVAAVAPKPAAPVPSTGGMPWYFPGGKHVAPPGMPTNPMQSQGPLPLQGVDLSGAQNFMNGPLGYGAQSMQMHGPLQGVQPPTQPNLVGFNPQMMQMLQGMQMPQAPGQGGGMFGGGVANPYRMSGLFGS